MFNELVIKVTPVKKSKTICCFMEWVHLPHGKVSLKENGTFHHKVLSKFYRNSNLNFLANFNFVLSTSKKF